MTRIRVGSFGATARGRNVRFQPEQFLGQMMDEWLEGHDLDHNLGEPQAAALVVIGQNGDVYVVASDESTVDAAREALADVSAAQDVIDGALA